MKVSAANGKRFIMFNNEGLNLCLMNGYYDSENPEQVVTKGEYWKIYDNQSKIANSINTRKVYINLGVEDLKAEYNRIKELGIAVKMTEILSKLQAIIQKKYNMYFAVVHRDRKVDSRCSTGAGFGFRQKRISNFSKTVK